MRNISILIVVVCFFVGASANAACTNKEYKIYQAYDRFLNENPSIPDYELRVIFAKKINMSSAGLKNLYMNCLFRWAEENPRETGRHVDKIIKR